MKDEGLGGEEAASSCFARDVSASIGAPNLILCAVGNLLGKSGDLINSLRRLCRLLLGEYSC